MDPVTTLRKHINMLSRKLWPLAVMLVTGGCFSVDVGGLLNPRLEEITLRGPISWTRDRIVVVDIDGLISVEPAGILAPTDRCTPDGVRAVLDRAERDPRVKAVVLRINSPGGGVAATDMVTHEIASFRKRTGLPVVAVIMAAGCSGGYYIATAADQIWAHPASVTGSIGVVAVFPQFQGLTGKIGIGQVVVKSGDLKDMGSPLREMSPQERDVFQRMIDDYYELFLDRIVASRSAFPTRATLAPYADGRVFTAGQAVEAGLVDRIGHMDDVLWSAMALAGIRDARIVAYAHGPNPDATPYSAAARASLGLPELGVHLPQLADLTGGPGFHYLWLPGASAR